MLFRELDKLKRSTIMTTNILMFIGLVLLVVPEGYIPFLSHALGYVLLVVLVISILDFISSAKALIHYIYLFLGMLAGSFGLMFLLFDGMLMQILSWLVSLIPIISGIYGIYYALVFARRSGRKGWWVLILMSGSLIIFGGFIFFNPWKYSTVAVMQVIGGTLLFSAFVSALRLIWPLHKEKES